MTLLDTLRERFGIDLQELSGTALAGEIPLPENLLNRLIAERLARAPSPVTAAQLQIQDAGAAIVQLSMRARIIPSIRIALRIEAQPELPHNPVLLLRWSLPGLGPMALLAGPALALFKVMPPGVRIDGDRIAVDLRELLVSRGVGDLLAYVRDLRIGTRRGAFVVGFQIGV